MIKILLLAIVGGVLTVAGAGQLDDLRSEVRSLRANWFDELVKPTSQAEKQKKARSTFAAKANSICTDHAEEELNLRVAIPRNRAEFVRVLGASLEAERVKLAALKTLQPPPNYDISYFRFLRDREAILAALEHVRQAVRAKDRPKLVRAARSAVRLQASINGFVLNAEMPACVV